MNNVYRRIGIISVLLLAFVGAFDASAVCTWTSVDTAAMDPEDWVGPIVELAQDADKMEVLGQNCYEAVQKHYSWEAICKKIEAALQDVLASK